MKKKSNNVNPFRLASNSILHKTSGPGGAAMLIARYGSGVEAGQCLSVSPDAISLCVNGKTKTGRTGSMAPGSYLEWESAAKRDEANISEDREE